MINETSQSTNMCLIKRSHAQQLYARRWQVEKKQRQHRNTRRRSHCRFQIVTPVLKVNLYVLSIKSTSSSRVQKVRKMLQKSTTGDEADSKAGEGQVRSFC